ncbi:MAG TPA: hypothetical protein P5554_12125 [Spirochaetota bacterium]|nr:hypothetical protein [Spirochaetota bacterium]
MRYSSKNFLSQEDIDKIESTIKEVESKTSGEIVVMVVERSSTYRDVDLFVGFILSIILSFVPAEFFYVNSDAILSWIISLVSWYSPIADNMRFTISLLVFVAFVFILQLPLTFFVLAMDPFKRLFIPQKRKEEEVKERAFISFYQKGLNATRDKTGVLFFISILERTLYILADKGIYEKIKDERLQSYSTLIARGIKENKTSEALCKAINDVGQELIKHFPIKPDDTNELSNSVIIEK